MTNLNLAQTENLYAVWKGHFSNQNEFKNFLKNIENETHRDFFIQATFRYFRSIIRLEKTEAELLKQEDDLIFCELRNMQFLTIEAIANSFSEKLLNKYEKQLWKFFETTTNEDKKSICDSITILGEFEDLDNYLNELDFNDGCKELVLGEKVNIQDGISKKFKFIINTILRCYRNHLHHSEKSNGVFIEKTDGSGFSVYRKNDECVCRIITKNCLWEKLNRVFLNCLLANFKAFNKAPSLHSG